MRHIAYLICLAFLLSFASCTDDSTPRILVFSKTEGYRHASIPNGIAALEKLGTENGFRVDTTSNNQFFTDDNLKNYSSVVFLSTTGDVLDAPEEIAFERYIQSGGGFVGVHAATDTEYGWGWYGKLVGAYFESHPATQEAKFLVNDKQFKATHFFKNDIWKRKDELYNFKQINPDVNVVMSIDETSYEGGTNGKDHPMAWYHEFDGGRAFYTALGHTEESYVETEFLQHLLGGLQYSMGDNQPLDYSKVKSQIAPDGDRFIKKSLVVGEFYEPTEMTILPNKDVLIAERRGALQRYSHETGVVKQVGFLDVYHATSIKGVNAEEGFMGLQKDPNFAENKWIYCFYAPTGNEWVNRLSRFKFENDTLNLSTEQVILDVASQREICCHTGGSIAFGPGGLLYLSTGDNSTPFDEPKAQFVNNGYAPLNDLPGREQYDARRSSANTNDLRGKILRIKVNEDGSYDIPEGNLFPKGTAKTRPEIYTMGHRNPYRISVDPKNGYVYWGDVGPDAREDKMDARGPKGYDEMNQAREAGNFGWPMFIADNQAYFDYDYQTGISGPSFEPTKPINDSKNNTGLRELPPAQSAYLFYPYDKQPLHDQVESGGRNAMAGPVYYKDLYNGENALPAYYDGKVIIYDWIRGWMKAVTLFEDGTFNKIEPFAPNIEVSNLIDVEVSNDGTIYLLEYGAGWFAKNVDSGLGIIEYNQGNRAPAIANFTVNKTSGKLPLEVEFKVVATDKEDGNLTYEWDFGNDYVMETDEPIAEFTYEEAGEFMASVEVKDAAGKTTTSQMIPVSAGNARPEVAIQIEGGNTSFFLPGQAVNYEVSIKDKEDGENIDLDKVYVSVDYMEGFDEVAFNQGHLVLSDEAMGQSLTQALDCKACHKVAEKSVGPSYNAIAQKYTSKRDAAYIANKIIKGGSGVWGEKVMAAHPDISPLEAQQMAAYIRSLNTSNKEPSLPIKGSITPAPAGNDQTMVITASYMDKGAALAKPLKGSTKIALTSNTLGFSKNTLVEGFSHVVFGELELLVVPADGGWFAIENIDLTGVKAITATAGWQANPSKGMRMTVHLDSPDGEQIGEGFMPVPAVRQNGGLIKIELTKSIDTKLEKLYFVYEPTAAEKLGSSDQLAIMKVRFD